MKVVRKVLQTVEVDVFDDIKCNKCGSSILFQAMIQGCSAEMYFGYGSNRDAEMHKFHLCDKCADELIKSFVHPSDVTTEF